MLGGGIGGDTEELIRVKTIRLGTTTLIRACIVEFGLVKTVL